MTNGPHQHTCSICKQTFWCRILVECYVEELYAVCSHQACVEQWDALVNGDLDDETL